MFRGLCYSIIFLMLMSSVFAAASFSGSTQITDNRIFTDEVAEFMFTIQNLDVEQDQYTIYTTDPSWNVYHEGTSIYVDGKSDRTFEVILDPTSVIVAGKIYSVPVTIKSLIDGEETAVDINIIVDSDSQRTYKPSVFVDLLVGENGKVNPSKPVEVTLRLINKNQLNMENVYVELEGSLISDSFNLNLGPKEEVTKILTYEIDPLTQPASLSLDATLYYQQKAIGPSERTEFEIIKYQPSVNREVLTDEESSLKTVYIVELTNDGNVETTEQFLYPLTGWEQRFTESPQIDGIIEKDGQRYAIYDVTLAPGESTLISIETNYRTFTFWTVLLVVLIVGSIVAYYVFRAPIVVQKRVHVTGSDSDGISKLKVVLDVKNRTGKLLKNIRVIERAPNITEVDQEFAVGTMAPSKIVKHALKGTLIRWDLPSIEPYEERIITYNIHSKLSILGDLKLPSTLVKFESFGHTRTVREKEEDLGDDE